MAIRNLYVHMVHIHMEIPYGFSISIRLMDRKPEYYILEKLYNEYNISILGRNLLRQLQHDNEPIQQMRLEFLNVLTCFEAKQKVQMTSLHLKP
jgi:hypothetical protein